MVAVRPARPDDAAAIAAIYAPHVTAGHVSFETDAPDAAEIARRMDGGHPWLVAAHGATVIGYAYASAFGERAAYRLTVETTIYLADAAKGRGVGRQLYAALLDLLSARGFAQAIARIALPNPASCALHAALGFREVGVLRAVGRKHGHWIDVALWQCALDRSVTAARDRPAAPAGTGSPPP